MGTRIVLLGAMLVGVRAVVNGAEKPTVPSGKLAAAGQVQDVPGHWRAPGMRRVSAAGTQASSSFAPESGQYASARAADGNRGTKWVASVAPSREKPQWIVLELFGSQEVSAVAVFGERIGNDGIQDAQVQVAGAQPGQFVTVAAVDGAKSSGWLASFEPVTTTAVRLLITRSGGPSTHTDVYEIEVYGPPLSPAKLKGYAAERLGGCTQRWHEVLATAEKLKLTADPQFAELAATIRALDSDRQRLADRFARWDALAEAERQPLAGEIERLEGKVQRLVPGLARAAAVWPARAQDIRRARQAALPAAGPTVASASDGAKRRLTNDRVSIVLDETDGTWDATWLGNAGAAVRRVGFAVQAGGQNLTPRAVRAEVAPLTDALGSGLELRQHWGAAGVEIDRCLRLYHDRPAVVVAGQIANRTDRDVTLNAARMVDLSQADRGWWHLTGLLSAPAAVGYAGATPPCRPAPDDEATASAEQHYGSAGLLALAQRESRAGLAIGYLSAIAGEPAVHARFQTGAGGTSLGATLSFGGRALRAGQTIALDPVWLTVEDDRFAALERYGDAVAALAPKPVRTGANALWCSWYPIRMGISEEIVLAHAAIAAKHFQPLGLDLMQLDHGWQRGDICGDWVPNERFPHGLKWLAEQLRARHGMKLGLWIAPTQVAVTSDLFRTHPEWMARGADGRPARHGRWFWVPNPEMTVLDAAQPAAERWIEETFARLTAEGASYYKIDFIAGSPALRQAMTAIRRGAGPEAWIRYCQTPPLLSVGLASSAYIGVDTGDAGLADWMNLERQNAPLLAASYWVNDRLYHREVCDMSVGAKADLEEARFRLALMTLSGCSISFSDDFRLLDPPRIRLMQQCLPPGNPPARPLDLFDRELPSLWHMHCRNAAGEWDAVGVFNFEDRPQERTVESAALGLPTGTEVVAFEFWEEKFLGTHRDRVTLSLAPRTARILLIHRKPVRPAVIATNMQVLGGYHEIKRLDWDDGRQVLSGRYQRAAGLEGKAYVYLPDGYRFRPEVLAAQGAVRLTPVGQNLWAQEVRFAGSPFLDWSCAMQRAQP